MMGIFSEEPAGRLVATTLFDPVPTVLSGQTLRCEGDSYYVTDGREVVAAGRVVAIDADVAKMDRHAMILEIMRLRSQLGGG